MTGSLRVARAIQVGFWMSGLAFLTLTYTGTLGLWGMAVSLAACIACIIAAMRLKCSRCGVSYYLDPSTESWSMGGINLFRPVRRKCPKCDAERASSK
jgi:hypothetical protein